MALILVTWMDIASSFVLRFGAVSADKLHNTAISRARSYQQGQPWDLMFLVEEPT